MLLQSLRAHCKAPGGPGSIWKYLEALVRATRVSGRFACGFQTSIHFADVTSCGMLREYAKPSHNDDSNEMSYKAPLHHLPRFGCYTSRHIPEPQRQGKST